MDSKTARYQSRILREMRNNAENPFSPPSSTGSHGTVTLTSQFDLDVESTHEPMPVINTSVLGRTFPEWKGYKGKDKENRPPEPTNIVNEDNSSIFGPDSPRLRAHHQVPAVQDTMDLSAPLSIPRGNLTKLLDTLKTARSEKSQADQESVKRSSQVLHKSQPNARLGAHAARRFHQQSHNTQNSTSRSIISQTANSFFLPNLNHVNDFVSGTLRWSSLRNGMPIFVKHGRVHDRAAQTSPDDHADFEAVGVPREEEEIFVSLDKIREEIQTLQEHDEFVSKQAEQLKDEVNELQSHVTKLKSRKDSAMGSDIDQSIIVQLTTQNTDLEEQISSLKTRLDQANRKLSLNEIHNQSFVAERDEALQRVSEQTITIKRLESRNNSINQQKAELQEALNDAEADLSAERALVESLRRKYDMVSNEKIILKEDNLGLERQNEDLFNNTKTLQHKNTLLQQENNALQDKAMELQALVDELNKQLTQKTETQYTQESKGFVPSLGRSKLTKMTQNWESGDRRTVVSETSAKAASSRMHLSEQDNDTRETDITRNSRRRYTRESKGVVSPIMGKSKLTKLAHQESEDRHTVVSEMSAKTTTSRMDLQMEDDYTQQINLGREAQLESDEENMTSALFIDDVTLDSNKKFAQKQKVKNAPTVRVLSPVLSVSEPSIQMEQTGAKGKQKETIASPALTQSAKRVLNTLCEDHECYNCMVCARIQSHRYESNGKGGKKTVRVERPVPVSERAKTDSSSSVYGYEDQTMRPSQDPAIALAKVMKGLKDEERHIRTAIARKQAVYDECDAAVNKRLWKQLDAEIRVLRKRRDLKRDQIYDLHDVLEGQKANAQLMTQEAIDMTITSVLGKDPTWNGIIDY